MCAVSDFDVRVAAVLMCISTSPLREIAIICRALSRNACRANTDDPPIAFDWLTTAYAKRTADVERAHRQLRARLADRPERRYPDRSPTFTMNRGPIAAVALRAQTYRVSQVSGVRT